MAKFTYKAVTPEGRIVEGQVEAANESDLEARITNMDLDLIRYQSKRESLLRLIKGRVDRKELINFSFHLEQLIKAGVPIIEALTDLRDSTSNSAFRDVISGMIESIGAGKTFSEALSMYPGIFSNVYISMVEVGEHSGRLADVLNDLADMFRWQDELLAKARKMAMYPSFVLVIVLTVITFLMAYLVPQLLPFIKIAGEEVPVYTQALIVTSNFVIEYWYFILSMPVLLLIIFKILLKANLKIRYQFDKFKISFWLFGPIFYKIKLARFSNYFALMYSSGITVLDAISMSKRLMDNVVLEQALERAHGQISEGESISNAFANAGLFSALVVRMLKVGETTGAMTASLHNISYFYDREVKESIDTIEPAIMPIIIILLASIVIWVMVSVMGPIYDSVIKLSAF